MPLITIIADPLQNIALHPRDVITTVHHPFSLRSLGATERNEELNFESQGTPWLKPLAVRAVCKTIGPMPGACMCFALKTLRLWWSIHLT